MAQSPDFLETRTLPLRNVSMRCRVISLRARSPRTFSNTLAEHVLTYHFPTTVLLFSSDTVVRTHKLLYQRRDSETIKPSATPDGESQKSCRNAEKLQNSQIRKRSRVLEAYTCPGAIEARAVGRGAGAKRHGGNLASLTRGMRLRRCADAFTARAQPARLRGAPTHVRPDCRRADWDPFMIRAGSKRGDFVSERGGQWKISRKL
ncbi:hypothetical protein EVAR_69005_1 [Eumeta japonica]|uniref:Uncharacterized protein n=1 Tax=Eumeta variegata TaxID=151549 RepID=A0A4C1SJN9_EUMVA|nr:hypothetical protein EVAR_69005_1 [Eumeta japonica]